MSSLRERNRNVCRRCRYSTTDEQKFLHHIQTQHPGASPSDWAHSLRHSTDSERSASYEEGHSSRETLPKPRTLSFSADERSEEDLVLRSGLTLPTRTYTCSDCGASTTNPRQHLHHLVQDHGYDYTIYECDLCDYATRYKQKLPRHRRCHFVSPAESRVLSPPQLPRRTRSHSEMEVDKIPYNDQKDDLDSRSDDSGVKDINENVKDGNDVSDDRLKVTVNTKSRDEDIDDDEDDDQSLVIDTRVTPSHAGPFIVEKPSANSPVHMHTPVATMMAHPLPPVMPPKTTKKGTAPIREAVDPAKYIRVQDVDGIKYACSKCGNIYKWRKSLNKHWKEKHDGEIPTPMGPGGYAALNIPHLVGQGLAGLPFSLKSHSQSRLGMKGFPDFGRSVSHSLYSNTMNFDKSNSLKSAFLPSSPNKDTKWGMEGFRRSPVISTPSPKPPSMHHSLEKSFSLPSPGFRQHIPSEMLSSTKKPSIDKGLLTTASPYLLSVPPAAHSKGVKKSTPQACDEAPLDLSKASSKGETIIIEENNGEVLNLSRGESLASAAKLKTSNNFSTDFSKKIESVMNCYLSGGAVQVKQEMPDVYAAGSFGVWQCFKCPYAAKDASDYEQHLASHAGSKNSASHRCAECQQTFSSLEDLNDHFGTAHVDLVKSYEAGDSDLLSKTRENLQLYRYLTMPKDGNYKCMVCGSVFSWQWDLARHFDKYHLPLPNPYQRHDSGEEDESLDGEPSPKRIRLEQDLTCQLCTFQARDREELRRHLLVHSLNKQYACTMCGYSTQWQDDLTQHIKRYHKKDTDSIGDDAETMAAMYEKKSYLNSLGLRSNDDPENETSRSTMDLSSHKSISPSPSKHHSDMSGSYPKKSGRSTNSAEILLPYKCSVCEYRARWPSEITQHMKNHSDEKPFRCPRCTYKSKWKWDVVKHLKRCGGGTVKDVIDTSKGKMTTPTWVKALQFKSAHINSGPPNVTVVSPSGERPNDGEALMPYYRGGEDSQESASSRSPAQLHCLQCPFISSSPAELKRHSRVHSDDKPFACITCGYSSKWKCDLKKHLRNYLHVAAPMDISDRSNDEDDDDDGDFGETSGVGSPDSQDEDRPIHRCTRCSFSSSHKSALDSHMKIHSQEKSNKLRCKQCDYEAADLPAFLQHKLVHSQETREMSVDREDNATPTADTPRHRRKPQKQFCCDRCPYTTFERSNMEGHHECHEATNLDFTCDYCDFSTNDQDVMDDHIKLHPEFFNDLQPQNNGTESDTDVEDSQADTKREENSESERQEHKKLENKDAEESEKDEDDEYKEKNHFLVESSHPNSHRQGVGESFNGKDSDGKCDSEENSSENEQMTDRSEICSCPKCPYTSCSLSMTQKHFEMHGSDGRFKCDTCDYAANRMNLLLQHKKFHVSNQLKGSYIPVTALSKDSGTPANRSTPLSCNMCPFVTNSIQTLQIHIQMHIMGRNSSSSSPVPFPISRPRSPDFAPAPEKSKFYYKCNRCPYQTNNRGNFESHKTQHQIRSKLQCPYCDYSSARSAQISSHVRLHFPGNQLESDVLWTLVLAANQTTEVSSSPSASEDPEADDSAHSTESDPSVHTNAIKKSCRYCDRQFPDMFARELHEKQHLVDVSVC